MRGTLLVLLHSCVLVAYLGKLGHYGAFTGASLETEHGLCKQEIALVSGELCAVVLPSLNQNGASGMLSEAFSFYLPPSCFNQTGPLWQLCTGILINKIKFL